MKLLVKELLWISDSSSRVNQDALMFDILVILWRSYSQGRKLLDHLSLFGTIHLFTELKWSFYPWWDRIRIPNFLSLYWYGCHCWAQRSGIRTSKVWINIEIGEQRKSLVNMFQRSNTFAPWLQLGYRFTSQFVVPVSKMLCTQLSVHAV